MKTIIFISIWVVLTLTASAQDARQIAEKSSKAIEFESLEMSTTLKISDNKGNVRTRQVATWTRKSGETTRTLIQFLAPADIKGTAMLIYDHETSPDDMWLYLPSLRKTRRIVSSEKSRSFMGSEFSNADMTQPNLGDFTYKITGTLTLNNSECWLIEARCRDLTLSKELGYTRKVMSIEKATFLPVKIEFYDISGKLLKVMTMEDYHKQSNGKYFAYRMVMENNQNGRKSEIVVDRFRLGTGIPESRFSVTSLGDSE